MTLCDCKATDIRIIWNISLPATLKRRLYILGMTQGTAIQVLRKKRSGTVIIKVRGVRYAIGATAARGIYLAKEGTAVGK